MFNFQYLYKPLIYARHFFNAVIDDKTCEERLWKMKHRGETNFYLCEINRDMVIDATYKGNKSRYINHSCCPNTEMQKWFFTDPLLLYYTHFFHLIIFYVWIYLFSRIIDGETRIGIFATRDIKKGEHLTYDYQYEHLHHSCIIQLDILLCILLAFSSKLASSSVSFTKWYFHAKSLLADVVHFKFLFAWLYPRI